MNHEYLEIKSYLSQLVSMFNMLIPEKASVSFLAESTGKSRQAIHQYLMNNYEPEKDFWNEGGKTYVSRNTLINILQRENNKKMVA